MAEDLNKNLISDKNIEVLKKFMISKDMDRKDIKKIFSAGKGSNDSGYKNRIAKMCRYKKNETVIREGEFDSRSFWVVKGIFDVVQNKRIVATLKKPGEIFGEMSVFEGIPRTASVICRTEGICICIDMSVIDNLKDKKIEDQIKKGFYTVILKRLGNTKDRMEADRKNLETRYAELLDFEKQIKEKN